MSVRKGDRSEGKLQVLNIYKRVATSRLFLFSQMLIAEMRITNGAKWLDFIMNWRLKVMNDLYKRLARAEAISDAQKSELTETLKAAYDRACEERNEEDAALFARKIRNRMLDESDARMCFDRLGLIVPSGTTFSSWLAFLKCLGEAISGSWAKYRKDLRDLPEQPGFPFNVEFPVPPELEYSETAENEVAE